ncbi:MAG: polyprenyl diphosphate synthase, partial [bacterium]
LLAVAAMMATVNANAWDDNIKQEVAISYGGRDEILRAAKEMAADVLAGKLRIEEITEASFGERLDTVGVPDVDLVIRTGGNQRLSNFLPWQTVYAEIYFTPILWPDFSRQNFDEALRYYEGVQINRGK